MEGLNTYCSYPIWRSTMRLILLTTSLVFVIGSGAAMATEQKHKPTDPMSSSKGADQNPVTGHSTFDAPGKPTGPHGEIPGGGGPSGFNAGAGQKSPQFEGEKHKTPKQSEEDVKSKPGGKDAGDKRK